MAYDGDSQVGKGIVGTLVVLGGLILGPVWYGYVLSIMWSWFIVPTFHLPVLGKAIAIGLAITIKLITDQTKPDCVKKEKTFWETIGEGFGNTFVSPAFTLLYGYIVHQFI
jgi:phosphate/sulfate permease